MKEGKFQHQVWLTSANSNLMRPRLSPSAMAANERRGGCPMIDAQVSRCWCVSQSLKEASEPGCDIITNALRVTSEGSGVLRRRGMKG